jgi:Family of unknown function (DUF5681)
MTDDRKIRLTLPSSEPAYKVGYRKPPAESQFKPGRSGNPRGRPKGARNKLPALNEERLKGIIVEEAYRSIKIVEGKRQVTIPMAKAVVRALAVNAARGQLRSQQLFATLLSETEQANKTLNDKFLQSAIEYKRNWDRELERRRRLGIQSPDPIPHPDDVIIDMKRDQVRIIGPMTKEDKAEWDRMWDQVEECDRSIRELTEDLKQRRNKQVRKFIEDDIAHEKRIREIIVNAIGEPRRRGPKST